MTFVKKTGVDTNTKGKMNEIIREIILSIFLIGFVINAGYVVSGQADNEEFEKSVSAETAEEWNEKGISFGKSGEYEKAIECFNKAIELEPNYVKAYYYRGIAYGDLKQYEKAICDYNKAIELEPNYAKAYYYRGTAYGDLKQCERAIEDYNKAIELNPSYAKAYNNRGIAYARLGQYERAMGDFEKVIELDQVPGIMEEVVNDKSQNIMVECSLNYDINLNGSARATMFIDLINKNKYGLLLDFLEFCVHDEHSNITNVEVQVPYDRTFFERSCYSSADWKNRFKNLTSYDYCYHAKEKNGTWYKYICVAINKTLPPNKVTHLYVSYSIDDFVKFSKNDTKFLHVPYQSFYNVRVSECKGFRWNNVPGSDNEGLLEILRGYLNITWTENATISKYNNDTIIIISKDEQHSAKIIMDGNRRNAILEISDGNIRYLKIKEVDGKIYYICDTQPTLLKTKDYNVLINLPQDRYHYSKLLTVPHPHPDEIFMNEKSPALSWHFAPTNRNATHLLIPAYKIQKDYLMIVLDTFALFALILGFISVFLAVKDDKHKWRRLIIILVVICVGVVVIRTYILFTGLYEVYWELLKENLQKLLSS